MKHTLASENIGERSNKSILICRPAELVTVESDVVIVMLVVAVETLAALVVVGVGVTLNQDRLHFVILSPTNHQRCDILQ